MWWCDIKQYLLPVNSAWPFLLKRNLESLYPQPFHFIISCLLENKYWQRLSQLIRLTLKLMYDIKYLQSKCEGDSQHYPGGLTLVCAGNTSCWHFNSQTYSISLRDVPRLYLAINSFWNHTRWSWLSVGKATIWEGADRHQHHFPGRPPLCSALHAARCHCNAKAEMTQWDTHQQRKLVDPPCAISHFPFNPFIAPGRLLLSFYMPNVGAELSANYLAHMST